jgi:hypothetical protein
MMRNFNIALSALSAAFFANAASVVATAVDGVQAYPLEFHFVNDPNGFMICPAGEFKCGQGCCHDVSLYRSLTRALSHD